MVFLLVLLCSFALSAMLARLVRRYALAHGVVDAPGLARKVHQFPTPLLGGIAVYLACLGTAWAAAPVVLGKDISLRALLALTIGGALLMVGGYLDDRWQLSPAKQLTWVIAAALVAVFGGIQVHVVTNPLGGLFELDSVGLWLPPLVSLAWLVGMMFTTKLLDGLDGLSSGTVAIGSLIIFGLTQFTPFYQPAVGFLALALAGACLGFLLWNWHPALLFLGQGGSLFLGFALGALAIISGAKIATALLVMGIPVLDVAWAILRRLWRKVPVAGADRLHLHHRLLDLGLTQPQAVGVLYVLSASFGLTSLFLGTRGKLMALSALVVVMVILGWYVMHRYQNIQKKNGLASGDHSLE